MAVMKTIDLSKMNIGELSELISAAQSMVDSKKEQAKNELKVKIAKEIQTHGFALQDLFGKPRKVGTVAIKYRDPKNPEHTWTGRGRTPTWLQAHLDAGVKKEKFLIKEQA